MADNPDVPAFGSRYKPARLAREMENRLRELTDALIEEVIGPSELEELQAMVIKEPAAAAMYYRLVHLWTLLPLHLSRPEIDLSSLDNETPGAARKLDESMILPAITDFETEPNLAGLASPTQKAPPTAARPKLGSRRVWFGSAAAALLLGASGAMWWSLHSAATAPVKAVSVQSPGNVAMPLAVVTATANVIFDAANSKQPGSVFDVGETLQLQQGAIELKFADGAVAVVRAPARIHMERRNAIRLESGTLTAHVPASAHGFCVTSPGLSVSDLGTDFGVKSAAGSDASELQVFSGRVSATRLNGDGAAYDAPRILTEGQALRYSAQRTTPVQAVFDPAGFDRSIDAVRMPVPAANTGVDAVPGGADPHWQIVSVPFDTNCKPTPAIAPAAPQSAYPSNTSDSRWITWGHDVSVAAGDYVFRTSIDLEGFDPATVSVIAQVAADNCISDIRVNQSSTGISTTASLQSTFIMTPIVFPAAPWRDGANQVDVVVHNTNFHTPDGISPMAFRLRWNITACARAVR